MKVLRTILFLLAGVISSQAALIGTNVINIGAAANDGTGDPIRVAFSKINNGFEILSTNLTLITTNGLVQNALRTFQDDAEMVAADPSLGTNAVVMADGSVWLFVSDSIESTNSIILASSYTGYEEVGRWFKRNQDNPIVVDASGFITNYTVVKVRDRAALKNVIVTNGIQLVYMSGVLNPADKGEGFFLWDPDSVAVEDGGIIVAPNNQAVAGNWKRVATPETVFATWWDPVVTNGTVRLAIDYASTSSKGTVILPGEDMIWDFTDPVAGASHVTVMGQTGTRIIASDSPTASYSAFAADGVEGFSVQNVTIVGWANAPGGDTNNTGYAITLHNITNCIFGGIVYQDFYTQPLLNSGGVVGNGNKFFGPQWEPNSIEGYGADRTGASDSTAAVKFALDNTGGPQSVMGGRIIWPAALWSGNFVITNKNIIIDGESYGVDNTITNNKIMPWDPTQFAMTVGCDFAGTSLSGSQQGIMLNHLRFDANGPNGLGIGGLHVQAGTYHAHVTDCSSFDGTDSAMLVDCGSNRENFYALFTRSQFQCGDGLVTNNAVRFSSGISITTLAEFSSCEIRGANNGGHAMTVDSGLIVASGSTRIQCANNHGVLIQKSTAPASNPKLYGNWNIDSDFSTDVLVELPDDGPPVNYFVGNVDIDGRIKAGTSGITYIMKNSVLSVANYIPDALLTSASVYNNLYLQDQNSITNVGPTNSIYLTGFNGAMQLVNNKSGIYATPNTYFYLNPTNGSPTMLFQGQGQYSVTLTITFTNLPVENSKITNNGTVWTWGGGATFTGFNIPTNATVAGSAANLLTQFQNTGLTGAWNYDSPSSAVVRATRWYYSLTNGVSSGWCTAVLVTNTTANDVFTSSVSVPDSTNMAIQAANYLYLNSTNGSRAVTIAPNGTNGAITVNGFGVGVLRTPTGAHLEVDGRAGLGIEASISSARVYTNDTATTQAQIEAIQTLRPTTASSAVSHTFYGAQLVESGMTYDINGLSFPFRSELYHGGSGNIAAAGGFYVGNPTLTGGGSFGSYVGFRSELSSGNNKFAFVGNGTAPSRFNGNVGIGKVPTVPLDVSGNATIDGAVTIVTNANAGAIKIKVLTASSAEISFADAGVGSNLQITAKNGNKMALFMDSGNLRIGNTAGDPDFGSGLACTGQRLTPAVNQSLSVSTTIAPSSLWIRLTANAAKNITATPTMGSAGTQDGATVFLLGSSDANTITVHDNDDTAGTKLQLGAATRVLGKGDILQLFYNSTDDFWYEVSFSNN